MSHWGLPKLKLYSFSYLQPCLPPAPPDAVKLCPLSYRIVGRAIHVSLYLFIHGHGKHPHLDCNVTTLHSKALLLIPFEHLNPHLIWCSRQKYRQGLRNFPSKSLFLLLIMILVTNGLYEPVFRMRRNLTCKLRTWLPCPQWAEVSGVSVCIYNVRPVSVCGPCQFP